MTHSPNLIQKILRPVFIAAFILLSGPVFALVDQTVSHSVATEDSEVNVAPRTTIIYKNSFYGT
jgi:hypothetical protein